MLTMKFFDILYMQQTKSFAMNKALASIFLSLIMLTGVTAGSVAFAEDETDEETEEEIEIEVEIEDGVAKIEVEINDEEFENCLDFTGCAI